MRKNLTMLYFGLFSLILFIGVFSPLSEVQGYYAQSIEVTTGKYISGDVSSTYYQDSSDYVARSTGLLKGRKIRVVFTFCSTPSTGRLYYKISTSLGANPIYTMWAKVVYSDGTTYTAKPVVLDDTVRYVTVGTKQIKEIQLYEGICKYYYVKFYFDYINLI